MEAGFDGVMIHGANSGSLPANCFPAFSTSGPMPTAATSKAVPNTCWTWWPKPDEKPLPDFPVILRLMGSDRLSKIGGTDGWSIEECVELCKLMEANGATAVNITSGSAVTPE